MKQLRILLGVVIGCSIGFSQEAGEKVVIGKATLVVGEVKTPVRMSISWQDGATDFMGGDKHYWANQSSFFVPNLL